MLLNDFNFKEKVWFSLFVTFLLGVAINIASQYLIIKHFSNLSQKQDKQ